MGSTQTTHHEPLDSSRTVHSRSLKGSTVSQDQATAVPRRPGVAAQQGTVEPDSQSSL
jgi:hypothetical protein